MRHDLSEQVVKPLLIIFSPVWIFRKESEPYENYILEVEFKVRNPQAIAHIYSKYGCGLIIGTGENGDLFGDSGVFDSRVKHRVKTKEVDGKSMTTVLAFRRIVPVVGQWHKLSLKIKDNQWEVQINGREVNNAACSVTNPSPLWIWGYKGFEIRSIKVKPLD